MILSFASPISTFISNLLQNNIKILIVWQFIYCVFLAFVWTGIFYTQKNGLQAKTVAFSIIVPMVLDTLLIHFLNGHLDFIKIFGTMFVTIGLYFIFI